MCSVFIGHISDWGFEIPSKWFWQLLRKPGLDLSQRMYIQHNFNYRGGVSLPNALLAFYYSRTSSFCVYPAGVVSSSRLALVYLIMLLGRFKECIISEYCRTPCARSVCWFCYATSMLNFHKMVMKDHKAHRGPLLVHCRWGVLVMESSF